MNQFKRAKVVMLSTNKFSRKNELVIDNSKLLGIHLPQNPEPSLCYSQHLYIISDDEIKEGDWYLNSLNSHTIHCHFNGKKLPNYGVRKIIATTDTSLQIEVKGIQMTRLFSLPQPSQQFIEKYIEEYNKGCFIKDVLVEYEEGLNKPLHEALRDSSPLVFERLKINSKDNTITIKKLKDSWNREEVIKLLKQLKQETIDNHSANILKLKLNKWIEENL